MIKKKIAFDQEMITGWQNEVKKQGFVKNEGEVVQYIQYLKANPNPELESVLLILLAQSRTQRLQEVDDLAISWLKRAKQLNPSSPDMIDFHSKIIFSTLKTLPFRLDFPYIREADNRTTKKKLAEDYISRCKLFLEDYEDSMNNLENLLSYNEELGEQANKWMKAIEELKLQIEKLLKASEEYYASISGVFHTSVYLDEIKISLEQIENIKKVFLSGEGNKKEKGPSSLQDLEQMIGMNQVKERVHRHSHFIQYQKRRKELGFTMKDEISLNMVFTGNPGTGKTSLARMLAKVYFELGVLTKTEVIEVDRSHLVGSYVGQTEENVKNAITRALGGVLFIDEAYSLKRDGQGSSDYGQTAIDTLVSLMTSGEFAGKFAVILAGYPEEMRQFLSSNPGLRSRFPESNHIHLPDYTNEELLEIAKKVAIDNDYLITEEALIELETRIEKERVDESFGNARTVKNIVLDSIFQKGATIDLNSVDSFDLTLLEKKDLLATIDDSKEKLPDEMLNELIALEGIKEEMKKIQHFVQLQQVRKEKGYKNVPVQLHAVFSGNPGTGKTTVAKIYAKMLKETGLLKRGHLVVASRADLVAGFVGQTALKTKKKIRDALGGVLFIDEAYSLLSNSPTDFSKEAIDTIVDEMTKHNDNLVIVLAGYSKEMDGLLKSNPGLHSRFKKFFHFPDYTSKEMVDIILNTVKQYEYELTSEAIQLLKDFTENHKIEGNGRFAHNIVDELLQIQAARIMEQSDVTEDEFSIINEKDVEEVLSSYRT
ncbi:SpoVK/Ycf46/Vps4 family AAA+-type ATPase [Bacillus mesophilus]|uniref:AAA family ATPase n=1 Tax=Bacillus mesophilus TaxID=1808955 RepID=A0A6M0QB66_9BACI|nr:AAA family ATPase [Bacillus mesophilus]MBM7663116.1 SpoVK/Ycf46/Vps4 family AAA+-type ATPase [Bacillus mesophilus]NEY73565.1 AAA family ATPase [Bacillus mesophilus]